MSNRVREDTLFKALSEEHRRAIIGLLYVKGYPISIEEIERETSIFPGHLQIDLEILEQVGLISRSEVEDPQGIRKIQISEMSTSFLNYIGAEPRLNEIRFHHGLVDKIESSRGARNNP